MSPDGDVRGWYAPILEPDALTSAPTGTVNIAGNTAENLRSASHDRRRPRFVLS
jgi:hypothetical protein